MGHQVKTQSPRGVLSALFITCSHQRVSVSSHHPVTSFSKVMSSFLTAPLQEVHLEVVPIAGRNHEVNLTAIILPTEANLTVFYWWIGDSLQVSCVPFLHITFCEISD